MINQHLVDSPVFSFRIGPSEADGGEAVFGGIDESHYTGEITYIPVRRKAYWEVKLSKVAFDEEELVLPNAGAAIDTGQSNVPSLCCKGSHDCHRHIPDRSSHRYC